jgi:serine/threonine protein kinase
MSQVPSIIGRYEVERLLGEGGMGVLYLARDPVIDRHVALKLLRVNGEDLRRRFMREAQSAGRLQHPNIVTVYDVGDHDGQLYIAMEYIDGDTLGTLIRDDVPFSMIRKLDIVDEIADGLGYAHQRGIIHRDIKPANLMISRAGLVKVLDFGIARLAHRESREIDGPTLIGTPAYMAPEQLEGAEVDARSDIYAVGLVMYELFSGRRAFAGATTADVLQQVLAAQPTPIERLVPDIDPDLAKVIARAMARDPKDRYQDLQAMRKDLARARRRAMQASADDATIVVSVPTTRPMTGPVASPVPITVVPPTPTPAPAPTATPASRPPTAAVTQEDRALAHLASQRDRTARPPAGPALSDETVYAPVAGPVGAPVGVPAGLPVGASSAPLAPPPLPPLPTVAGAADVTTPQTADDLVPVPLPAVPSSGVFPLPSAGRATVDAPVIAAARDRAAAVPAAPVDVAPQEPRASSPPRMAVPVAPPPVASPGSVQSLAALGTSAGPPRRKGLSAGLIVGAMLAMLALCFVVALMAARSFGLLGGTVEPKVAPAVTQTAEATDVPVPPPGASPVPDVVPPAGPATESAPVTEVPVEPVAPAVTTPAAPPAPVTTVPPASSPAVRVPAPVRESPRPRPGEVPPARVAVTPERDVPRDVEPPVVSEPAPRPVERREPDPPPVEPPEDEGLGLVRGYVAARNTAHASGIRRVWPGVDDNHLKRVTSSFSAPLTLTGCEITSRDASHAVAACQLTQPGTTGAYAPGQGLTIRRTFVFDLVRQGRGWVIAAVRE